MDKAQVRERVNAIRTTMGTSGWVHLKKDWAEDMASLEKQAAYGTKSFEEVATIRGALNVLHRLINLESVVDQLETSLADEDDIGSEA